LLVEVLFWIFASILAVSALAMITVRNPVHSALLLVLCFFTSAASGCSSRPSSSPWC
jgi:NADH:ubiquinone oxidoreductase subunit 6 (subunit J)